MLPGALGHTLRSRLTRLLTPLRRVWRRDPVSSPPAEPASAPVAAAPTSPAPPPPLPAADRVGGLQKALGRQFGDPTLLREALTHRSYLNEIDQAWPSNERLEFLGDAVLGLISTDYLFRRFPTMGEGELTNLRSALVRTETLARFAQEIDLGQYLFLGRGEEMSAGRRRPAGLACAFEALLGAIYVDQGYDAVRDFVLGFLERELAAVVEGRLHKNAKSVLQELVQARMQQTPSYHLVEEAGPDHAKSFTVEVRVGDRVLGRGHDRSKRGAEQAAAETALQRLNSAPAHQGPGL
ncbi:MAG: ribonuclease III [Chloroflexi bacterium]|nr:ribonuclease III [Chloroflexota bacterium]